jgi:hypothetical protein
MTKVDDLVAWRACRCTPTSTARSLLQPPSNQQSPGHCGWSWYPKRLPAGPRCRGKPPFSTCPLFQLYIPAAPMIGVSTPVQVPCNPCLARQCSYALKPRVGGLQRESLHWELYRLSFSIYLAIDPGFPSHQCLNHPPRVLSYSSSRVQRQFLSPIHTYKDASSYTASPFRFLEHSCYGRRSGNG